MYLFIVSKDYDDLISNLTIQYMIKVKPFEQNPITIIDNLLLIINQDRNNILFRITLISDYD